jgi:hypothetical protein
LASLPHIYSILLFHYQASCYQLLFFFFTLISILWLQSAHLDNPGQAFLSRSLVISTKSFSPCKVKIYKFWDLGHWGKKVTIQATPWSEG